MKKKKGESDRGFGVNLDLPRRLLVDILGRRGEDFLGVVLAHKLILGRLVVIAFDDTIGDDCENPEHPQKHTDAASEDKSDRATLPRTQCHKDVVDASEERAAVMVE